MDYSQLLRYGLGRGAGRGLGRELDPGLAGRARVYDPDRSRSVVEEFGAEDEGFDEFADGPEFAGPSGVFAEYGAGEEMPLGGYAAILGGFVSAAAAVVFIARMREKAAKRSLARRMVEHEVRARTLMERMVPQQLSVADMLLLGAATHKLSRMITKDWVTAPLRAPFTMYDESLGGGEVKERSRGTGLRRAVGDLLTCQFCMAAWVAGMMSAGLVFVPRLTRRIAGMLVMVTIAHWLHAGYERVRGE